MSPITLAILASCAQSPHAFDISQAQIVCRADAPELERFAVLELRRYLSQLTGKPMPITSDGKPPEGPAIVVGAADSASEATPAPDSPDDERFMVKQVGQRLILRGRNPVGTLYAVYDLLERLGMGFYLGGDTYPAKLLDLPENLDYQGSPALRIRGSLPWYNFLNSPTTWNREDFKAFFDQMSKMKMNFVGFHTYDHEPFGAYRDESGKLVGGGPLKTSLNYDWGAIGSLKTPDFGWGTGRCFDREVFGSHATTDARTDEDAVLRAERDLREGLAYARSRGIHVCVGFELVGDPYDTATQKRFRMRFADLLSDYPMIDYVWVWQSEGLGGGSDAREHGTPARARMEQLRSTFAYLNEEKRIGEASRMVDYVLLAHGVLKQLAPDKHLIVSGWGGDRWMRFSDFYLGFDKALPPDVIFAALDNIDPSAAQEVSHVYGKLSPQRQRWPIPWFESDGGGTRRDQWGPQVNVKPFTFLLRDALKKGCQGALGIHWRTRGVEEVVAYTAQFAWDPTLSYEAFYDRLATRCFGSEHAKELSAILRELESMGPRCTGTVGQVECGRFDWTTDGNRPDPRKLQRLDQIAQRLAEIQIDLGVSGGSAPADWTPDSPDGASRPERRYVERLMHLRRTIQWLATYDRAIDRFLPGGPVERSLTEAATAQSQKKTDAAEQAAWRAWEEVRTSGLGDAIRTYAQTLTSQSEFGVLATINVKAVAMYRQLVDRIAQYLPVGPPLEPQYRRTTDSTTVSWRPVAGASEYLVFAVVPRLSGSTPIRTRQASATLPKDFSGEVSVVAVSKDGKQGPPSETLHIRRQAIDQPVAIVLPRPATSFGAGEALPVSAAIVSTYPIDEATLCYRFPAGQQQGQVPMKRAFGETYSAELPLSASAVGTMPPWVEFWLRAKDAAGRTAEAPVGRPRTVFSATIDARPFARMWPPVSDTPPVAGKDWPVVLRVDMLGPQDGVSVALRIENGQEVAAQPQPYGSYKAIVPAAMIRDPQVKLATVVTRTQGGSTETVHSQVWTFKTDSRPPSQITSPQITSPQRYQVILSWSPASDDTGVVSYKVEKDGQSLGNTALTTWFDGRVPSKASIKYRLTATDRAGREGEPRVIEWKAPDWPPPGAPQALEAREGFGLVLLKWKSPEEGTAFQVLRSDRQDGDFQPISGDKPLIATEYVDHPPKAGTPYSYKVCGIDPMGKQGPPSTTVTATPKPVPLEPILVADFDSPEKTGRLQGGARIGTGRKGKGLDLTEGGWADFPDRPEYDDLTEFTLSLWIRPDSLGPMPVVLSHGHWMNNGIFIQLLGNSIRTFIGGGRHTDGGSPQVGKWQHIAVVRRGNTLTTFLNGNSVVMDKFSPSPVGAYRMPLRIGQYAETSGEYQTRGLIDEVKLYLRPLSDQDIQKEAKTPAGN